MNYTVSDFFHMFSKEVTLVAGRGGLARPVAGPGILDYELEREVRDRFFHLNSFKNLLVVTTFLYAKNNPHLIFDGVKYLSERGAAGLIVKNVFDLPLYDSVLRYAERRNFPIFTLRARDLQMEDLLLGIAKTREEMESVGKSTENLRELLRGKRSLPTFAPSTEEPFFTFYGEFGDFFDSGDFLEGSEKFQKSRYYRPSHHLFHWKEGAFLLLSGEGMEKIFREDLDGLTAFFQGLFHRVPRSLGVGGLHFTLSQGEEAFYESLYAAFLSEGKLVKYEEMGLYRLIFPLARDRATTSYGETILSPLWDYDIMNNGRLVETLEAYLRADGDLKEAGKDLNQHFNTVRYRLGQIEELTGLDYRSPKDLEELSLAVKIWRAKKFWDPERSHYPVTIK